MINRELKTTPTTFWATSGPSMAGAAGSSRRAAPPQGAHFSRIWGQGVPYHGGPHISSTPAPAFKSVMLAVPEPVLLCTVVTGTRTLTQRKNKRFVHVYQVKGMNIINIVHNFMIDL